MKILKSVLVACAFLLAFETYAQENNQASSTQPAPTQASSQSAKASSTQANQSQGVVETVVEEVKTTNIPDDLKQDIKSVLSYMDQLLDNLPEDKIAEFARSEHFELYKKLFTELGL